MNCGWQQSPASVQHGDRHSTRPCVSKRDHPQLASSRSGDPPAVAVNLRGGKDVEEPVQVRLRALHEMTQPQRCPKGTPGFVFYRNRLESETCQSCLRGLALGGRRHGNVAKSSGVELRATSQQVDMQYTQHTCMLGVFHQNYGRLLKFFQIL